MGRMGCWNCELTGRVTELELGQVRQASCCSAIDYLSQQRSPLARQWVFRRIRDAEDEIRLVSGLHPMQASFVLGWGRRGSLGEPFLTVEVLRVPER